MKIRKFFWDGFGQWERTVPLSPEERRVALAYGLVKHWHCCWRDALAKAGIDLEVPASAKAGVSRKRSTSQKTYFFVEAPSSFWEGLEKWEEEIRKKCGGPVGPYD